MSLATIHIAKSKAGLSDAEYRAILQKVAQVNSAKDAPEHLHGEIVSAIYRAAYAPTKEPLHPLAQKLFGLWYGELAPLLPEAQRNLGYLAGIIRKSAVPWLKTTAEIKNMEPEELFKAVEGLKAQIAYHEEQNTQNKEVGWKMTSQNNR